MTVAELIAELLTLPQNAQIYTVNDDGRAAPVGNPSVGFIRHESDFIQGTATEDDLQDLGFDEETIKETGGVLVEYVVGIPGEW